MSQTVLRQDQAGPSPVDIPLYFVTDNGTAQVNPSVPNTIFVNGGPGVQTEAIAVNGNQILINAISQAFNWVEVTSVSPVNPVQIVAQTGYLCYGSSLVTFLLPLTANNGDTFKIFSVTSRFQVIPNANQKITIGSVTGLIGATGTVTSNSPGDEITVSYVGNNHWQSESPQGTIMVTTS